jgi:hypothetical protein
MCSAIVSYHVVSYVGEDVHHRGLHREPSWLSQGDGARKCPYVGEQGIDTSRHGRPLGEAGSYALTNLQPASSLGSKL